MKKTDLNPERVAEMIKDFFIKNNLEFYTTRAEYHDENLKWLQDRKIPTYTTIYNRRYGDVLSFNEPPEFLILYTPELGGYVQYITPEKRYYASMAAFLSTTLKSPFEKPHDSVDIDSVTEKYLYSWALSPNYDLTELILGKNKPFLNWDFDEPWNEK